MAKNLQELVDRLAVADIQGNVQQQVTKITYDSRQVTEGTLFIALTGSKVDGHDFVTDACNKGAVAVMVQKAVTAPPGVTVIKVPDTRVAMQVVAPYFFDYPSQKLRLIGVTGTNGKTTTTHLIRAILMQAGYKVGMVGTIHNIIGDKVLPVRNTTPDVVDLQALLADMVAAGMDYAVMEVSSHALALGRVSGCEFDTGVFTNLTRDHLDFHVTFENYADAKAELFRLISAPNATKQGKTAVINSDDPVAPVMLAAARCTQITYGLHASAALAAKDIEVKASGASYTAVGSFGSIPLNLRITGVFNVYNSLAAIGAAIAEGIDPAIIRQALETFISVAGRFELVDAGQPFSVIVDYAHTPDGLENILKTAKQFATKRIIVVFGCGGDRDRTKRPIMGRLAMEYGDLVIATSDNPRSEDPASILREVEAGMQDVKTDRNYYEVIVDRREAIARALKLAQPEDVVIIAGKGHETYQILKDRTIAFDDREVARQIIREMI